MALRLWKNDLAAQQNAVVLRPKRAQRGARIARKPHRAWVDIRPLKDIPCQRLLKLLLVGCGERGKIGRLPAVECLRKTAHPFRHREVADAHLTQVVIEIAAKYIEKLLPEAACGAVNPAAPVEHEHKMKHNQIKTALPRIRHAVAIVERRSARLRHDHAIEVADAALVRAGPKKPQAHRVNSYPPRPLLIAADCQAIANLGLWGYGTRRLDARRA